MTRHKDLHYLTPGLSPDPGVFYFPLVSSSKFDYHTGMTTYQYASTDEISWKPIKKPAEMAESRLIDAILDGTFPINSHLPGERELSELLGVTRPTLREALQRLARDGWVDIHQGKPTRIRDYWREGRLGVLNALSEHTEGLPQDLIPDLLTVRLSMAPMYTALAVQNSPELVVNQLATRHKLSDSPGDFTQFDWQLQYQMTLLSQNAIFTLILNGFKALFLNLAPLYFSLQEAREGSLAYYVNLESAARDANVDQARTLTKAIMEKSIRFWNQVKLT